MDAYTNILKKLERFIRKYHTNQLIKGSILFTTLGSLYFIFIAFTESVLWLNTVLRQLLFWLFISVELGLLLLFIAKPIAKLLKLRSGLTINEASILIGQHFPEVKDKLLNIIQLKSHTSSSDLLAASIDQKAKQLSPIAFTKAVDYKANTKYIKYLAIPFIIVFGVFLFGKAQWMTQGLNRVVHFKSEFLKPAPFVFILESKTLQAVQGDNFRVTASVLGDVIPETVTINYNNESYIMNSTALSTFSFTFKEINKPTTFYLSANNVRSEPYTISILEAPSIASLALNLDYPKYLDKPNETLKAIGAVIVPEGTLINWSLVANNTESAHFIAADTTAFDRPNGKVFNHQLKVKNGFSYQISVSNSKLPFYESLNYDITVIKDEYPELRVEVVSDSINPDVLYYKGLAMDDYGLSGIKLVYYLTANENEKQILDIESSKSSIIDFLGQFPGQIPLHEAPYSFYFIATDNDANNNFKSSKSQVFSYNKLTDDEREKRLLQSQQTGISNLSKAIEDINAQDSQLNEFTNTLLQKDRFNFSEKKKLQSLISGQSAQNALLNKFTNDLKQALSDPVQPDSNFNEALSKRLKEQELKLQNDEELLKTLDSIQDKIANEELNSRIQQLAKSNSSKSRSLEQLLELTKRFYVQQKESKLKSDLDKLSEKQQALSKSDLKTNTAEQQEELNTEFDAIQDELDALDKSNKALKNKMDYERDIDLEDAITSAQADAKKELQKQDKSQGESSSQSNATNKKASDKQQQAAQQLKQLSDQMQSNMRSNAQDQLAEDALTLRQILDNLLVFSFEQEDLLNAFSTLNSSNTSYSNNVKTQQSLRENFEFIDDSLFALSLRQPSISVAINDDIESVYYNIDKSLEEFSDNDSYRGVMFQQYAITASNNLADMLSESLSSIQNQIQSIGSGQGSSVIQLPDIIKSQDDLLKDFEDALKNSDLPEDGTKAGDKHSRQTDRPSTEDLNGQLFDIYKQQQQLREQLEQLLSSKGIRPKYDDLLEELKGAEEKLISEGLNAENYNTLTKLKHDLLKLDQAILEQGQDDSRESQSNHHEFNPAPTKALDEIRKYFNSVEILIKQPLPLQPAYKEKVRTYFKSDD